METALPALFAFAGISSIGVIWHCVRSNLSAIASLRHAMYGADSHTMIVVNYLDNASALEPISSVRRPRQVRVPAPKPITHRLHQFGKVSGAA